MTEIFVAGMRRRACAVYGIIVSKYPERAYVAEGNSAFAGRIPGGLEVGDRMAGKRGGTGDMANDARSGKPFAVFGVIQELLHGVLYTDIDTLHAAI